MNLLLTTTAALALLAGAAHAETSGYVGAGIGNTSIDIDGISGIDDLRTLSLDGAVFLPVGQLGLQLDVGLEDLDTDGVDSSTVGAASAHLFKRTDKMLLGAVLGTQRADGLEVFGGGAEGQFFLSPKFTLEGAVLYGKYDDDLEANQWTVRTEARYFYTDRFSVHAGLAHSKFELDDGFVEDLEDAYGALDIDSTDTTIFSLGAEYQFASLPLSFTGGWEHVESGDYDVSSDLVRIGLRWSFGGNLLERDRSGASLKPFASQFSGSIGQTAVTVLAAAIDAASSTGPSDDAD